MRTATTNRNASEPTEFQSDRLAVVLAAGMKHLHVSPIPIAMGHTEKLPKTTHTAPKQTAIPIELTDIPIELQRLMSKKIMEKLLLARVDGLEGCKDLNAWCEAIPVACDDDSMWAEACVIAFGNIEPVLREVLGVATWKRAFQVVCAAISQVQLVQPWPRSPSCASPEPNRALPTSEHAASAGRRERSVRVTGAGVAGKW